MGVAPGGPGGQWPCSPGLVLERTIQRTTRAWRRVGSGYTKMHRQTIPCECGVRRRQLGDRQVRVVAVRDIRTRLAAEAEIRQLAHFRRTDRAEQQALVARTSRAGAGSGRSATAPRSLATININAFQSINDSLCA